MYCSPEESFFFRYYVVVFEDFEPCMLRPDLFRLDDPIDLDLDLSGPEASFHFLNSKP